MAEAGETHGWDAVRIPSIWGRLTLSELGKESAAVIDDQLGHRYYWLISTGTTASWQLPQGHDIKVLSTGCHITIPGILRKPPLSWRITPTPHHILTDTNTLCHAITTAIGPRTARPPS
ncbi:hypothetical protein ACPCTO_37220 [Streptomyces olivoreticuli]